MRTALRGAAVLAAAALGVFIPAPAYADPTIDPAEVVIGPDGGATQVISGAGATGFNARFSPNIPPGLTITDRYGETCDQDRSGAPEINCDSGAPNYRIHWPAVTDPALDGTRYQVRVLGGGARDFGYATVVFPPPPTTEAPEPGGPIPSDSEPTSDPTSEPSAEPSASVEPTPEPTPEPTETAGGGEPEGVNVAVYVMAGVAGVGLAGLVATMVSIGALRRKRTPRRPRPPVEYIDSGDAD